MVKVNNGNNYEFLCNVKLTKEKFPIAYNAKVEEFVANGMTQDEAEKYLAQSVFELELYYSKDNGCFAVEADAVENGATIYDPYTGEKCEDWVD